MITTYQSKTQTFVSSSGESISATDAQLNILIELRVANAIALDAQRGLVTQTLAQYRSDAVNDSVNPVV